VSRFLIGGFTWPLSCSFRRRNLIEQPPSPRPAGPATQNQRARCHLVSGYATFSPIGNLALAYIRLGALDAAVARLNLAIDVTERHRGGGGMTIICSAGRQLRRWRGSPEVQDVSDRIMALMAA
jgi:hypothetical protein